MLPFLELVFSVRWGLRPLALGYDRFCQVTRRHKKCFQVCKKCIENIQPNDLCRSMLILKFTNCQSNFFTTHHFPSQFVRQGEKPLKAATTTPSTTPTMSVGVKRTLTDHSDDQEPTKKLQTFEEPPWD